MAKSTGSDKNYNYKPKANTSSNYSDNVGARIPPHSIDAEISVLGAMMLDKSAVSKVMEIIEPDSFYNDNHKEIFKAILDLSDRGVPADLISLQEELTRRQKLEEVGGTFYLLDINKQTPTSANIEFHARLIQEKYIKRSLISTATNIIERSYDDSTDALDEVDIAESDIFKIAEKRFSSSFVDIKTLSHQALDVIAKLVERDKTGLTGVPTGYTDLDKFTGGFQNSDLIIIAARPSMGKTALALSIARNVAVEFKLPVAFFSIEMKDIQLVL
jgi:replicative DNA helicase